MINNAVLAKYDMPTLEIWHESWSVYEPYDRTQSEIEYYNLFLQQSNMVSHQLLEGAITTADCAEDLAAREFARQEIARLKGETPTALENKKTLEQRVTETEEKTELAVSYDEMKAAIMEGVNEV